MNPVKIYFSTNYAIYFCGLQILFIVSLQIVGKSVPPEKRAKQSIFILIPIE
jgi:hypothetical protein